MGSLVFITDKNRLLVTQALVKLFCRPVYECVSIINAPCFTISAGACASESVELGGGVFRPFSGGRVGGPPCPPHTRTGGVATGHRTTPTTSGGPAPQRVSRPLRTDRAVAQHLVPPPLAGGSFLSPALPPGPLSLPLPVPGVASPARTTSTATRTGRTGPGTNRPSGVSGPAGTLPLPPPPHPAARSKALQAAAAPNRMPTGKPRRTQVPSCLHLGPCLEGGGREGRPGSLPRCYCGGLGAVLYPPL